MFPIGRLWSFCQDDRSNDGAQQKYPDDFELQQILAEHLDPDRVGIAVPEYCLSRRITLCASEG